MKSARDPFPTGRRNWRKKLFWIVTDRASCYALPLSASRIVTPPDQRSELRIRLGMGRIARSIAAGGGFSSPFTQSDRPHRWEPAHLPYFMAGVFKVFGTYTRYRRSCCSR